MSQESTSPKSVKISANLPEDAFQLLKTMAYNKNVSMTEILRNAIERESYFTNVVSQDGKILTEDKKGNIRQILIK